MISLVVSDIDGTLLIDGELHEDTKRLIDELMERRPFALATGTRESKYAAIKDSIPHHHAIYEDGCIIAIGGTVDRDWEADIAEDRPYLNQAAAFLDSKNYPIVWKRHSFCLDLRSLPEAQRDEIIQEVGELEFERVTKLRNGDAYVNVFPSSGGKGRAALYLCDRLDLSRDGIHAVVDDENDIELVEVASSVSAMQHSPPSIVEAMQQKDGYLTPYLGHEGIQDLLRRIIADV